MPVYKYKTFEEAEQALWNFNPDEEYYNDLNDFLEFACEICPPFYPRGIFKFKTIEEANKHRDGIIIQNMLKRREEMDNAKS
jgi:hypothetical protein